MVWVDPRVGLGWVGLGRDFLKDFQWVGLKKLDPRTTLMQFDDRFTPLVRYTNTRA